MGRDDRWRTHLGPAVDLAFANLIDIEPTLFGKSHAVLVVLRSLAETAYAAPHPAAAPEACDGDIEHSFNHARHPLATTQGA